MTDRLSDKALRVLYQRCAAFVFPSSYEGFGLPILEAMHCGAPVVAGNNSSQIEVVGDAGLLFNVANAGELAAQLVRVLDDAGRARELRERAVVQARRFCWEETADKALDVLTRPHVPEPAVHLRSGRQRAPRHRIAFFSPLPPLRSGVSDYSARLLDELKRRYTIDLYHDAGYVPHIGLRSPDFGCYDYRLFERNARVLDYHALVYQMGNSPYHGYMYETLLRHPGIVTLHDLGIADFHFWYAQQPGVDGNAHIRREFEAFCGAGSRRGPARARPLGRYAGGDAGGLHPAGVPPQRPDLRAGGRRDRALALVRRAGAKPVPGPSWQDVRGRVRGHRPGSFPRAAQGDPRPLRDAAGGPDHRQPRTGPCLEDELPRPSRPSRRWPARSPRPC